MKQSHTRHRAVGPCAAVVVRASCWSCGAVLEKTLRGLARMPRRLNWRCDGCEVSWAGPGDSGG